MARIFDASREPLFLFAKCTAVQPAVVRVSLVKYTNIYGNRTEPALTVGQTADSQSVFSPK